MNNVLRLVKKTFTVGVVLATVTWSIGLAAFLMPLAAQAAAPVAGDLVKASTPAVYYYGSDSKRYVFPNEKTYKTWYANFSSVKTVTDAELAAMTIGGNVTYKPGAKMVKVTTDPKVYAVDAGGKLRHVASEAVALALYGATWAKSVEDVPDAFFVNYTTGAAIAAAADFVPATVLAAAASINADKGLGAVAVVTPVGGSGLTVALAADSPAATSVVTSNATTRQSASLLPMLTLNFSASADGAVKVTSLKLKKTGISADADVRNVYLYDDAWNRLAEYQSFTSGEVTFSSASGLFEVAAGTSKKIFARADMAYNLASGKTVGLSLLSAAGVSTNGAAVSGAFPLAGSLMTTAQVSDNAQVLLPTPSASVPTSPASVDPGQLGREVWRTTLAVTNQKVELRKLKFLVNGSVTQSDLQNFKLAEAGVQIGATAQVASDMTVSFDMTAAPYTVLAGVTKTLSLTADIVGGTNRSFKMSIQKYSDVVVWDTQYGNYTAVDTGSGGSFSVFEKTTSITINTGTLVLGLSTTSPTGNISNGATNVDLAKFSIKASGEAVKFSELHIFVDVSNVALSTTAGGLNDVKLLLDGVQVGQTADVYEETAKSFAVNFIVPSGATQVLTVRADVKNAASTNLTAAATVSVSLKGDGTVGATTTGGVAKGQVSLSTATVGTVAGQTLTVGTGALTVTKSSAFSDRTSSLPSGVPNASNVKIASFVVTAGAGEASDITQIILSDDETDKALGEDAQNLKLMRGSTQIGTTIGTLNTASAGSTYTFTPASAIRLAASEQYVVDVYADILSTVLNSAAGSGYSALQVDSVSATGVQTSTATSWSTGSLHLQYLYISSGGNLTVTSAADTPTWDQLVLGSTGNVLGKFRFAADSAEDITLTKLVLSNKMNEDGAAGTNLAATGTLRNLSLWDGSTQVGSTVSTLTDDSAISSRIPYAVFSGLSWTVPRNNSKTLTVKADLSSFDDGGLTSSTARLALLVNYASSAVTGYPSVEARGGSSGATMVSTDSSVDLTGTTDVSINLNYFDALKTKLSLAYAADAPSGLSAAASEQTVAKWVVSNAANVGNYTALVRAMNFTVSSAGASMSTQSTLKVYKDSITTGNQLASSNYCSGASACGGANYVNSTIAIGDFTDFYVAAGSSVPVIVTLGTSGSGFSSNETLTVGLAAGQLTWADDAYASSLATLTMVYSLPLAGKTLYY
ncbi:MAG: hypothetical protein AAB731_03110 [Patescibacteria group bacterium]